jgi:hypothetical protein
MLHDPVEAEILGRYGSNPTAPTAVLVKDTDESKSPAPPPPAVPQALQTTPTTAKPGHGPFGGNRVPLPQVPPRPDLRTIPVNEFRKGTFVFSENLCPNGSLVCEPHVRVKRAKLRVFMWFQDMGCVVGVGWGFVAGGGVRLGALKTDGWGVGAVIYRQRRTGLGSFGWRGLRCDVSSPHPLSFSLCTPVPSGWLVHACPPPFLVTSVSPLLKPIIPRSPPPPPPLYKSLQRSRRLFIPLRLILWHRAHLHLPRLPTARLPPPRHTHTSSPFLDAHPGGVQRIMMVDGSDLGKFWEVYQLHHRPHIRRLIEEYRIGNLTKEVTLLITYNPDHIHNRDPDPHTHSHPHTHPHPILNRTC